MKIELKSLILGIVLTAVVLLVAAAKNPDTDSFRCRFSELSENNRCLFAIMDTTTGDTRIFQVSPSMDFGTFTADFSGNLSEAKPTEKR